MSLLTLQDILDDQKAKDEDSSKWEELTKDWSLSSKE